jgi:hypothetical protein
MLNLFQHLFVIILHRFQGLIQFIHPPISYFMIHPSSFGGQAWKSLHPSVRGRFQISMMSQEIIDLILD